MKSGKCPLCLDTKGIIKSHLMSGALYDLCGTAESDPVLVTQDVVMQTGRQLKYPLLCWDCDNMLSEKGESWVLPVLARAEGRFPLYDMVVNVPPYEVDGETKLYSAAKNPEIDIEKLTHFAMGIFWKASIHSWRGDETDPLIGLGKYGESVRRFLKGDEPFPGRMALIVGVSPPPLLPDFIFPYRGSAKQFHNFLFHVPGVNFALNVGNLVSDGIKETCFASASLHPILVKDLSGQNLQVTKEVAAGAHKAKNLLKYLDESKELAEYLEKRGKKRGKK